MKTKVLLALTILVAVCFACEKDDSGPDLATSVAGTYTGSIVVSGTGSTSCTSILTKKSNDKVDLKIIISTTTIPLNGISVSSAGTDSWDLSYGDSSGSFEGNVQGNLLTWTLTGGGYTETFTGTR
ncbi:MAG: hypothetical protein RBT38_14085 [Bacteroidales bacterium]|jgi:hypothetical protein|nr:hypothetical protein [Bacteroidales bacterium]